MRRLPTTRTTCSWNVRFFSLSLDICTILFVLLTAALLESDAGHARAGRARGRYAMDRHARRSSEGPKMSAAPRAPPGPAAARDT